MKQIKLALILCAIFTVQALTIYFEVLQNGWIMKTIFLTVLSLVVFLSLVASLVLRNKLIFKSWILSKMNFLLSKVEVKFTSEIPRDLLFEKLLEVVEESDFDLADSNRDNFQILATTFPNFFTWGENMYIEIREGENQISEIKFTSATIFGYSWKRNKKNSAKFFQLFEESLTI